jgi:predicted Zn-dependent protease
MHNLALALRDLGRTEAAVDVLQRAMGIDARNEWLPLHGASMLLELGRTADAAKMLERALQLNPRNPLAQQLRGQIAVAGASPAAGGIQAPA